MYTLVGRHDRDPGLSEPDRVRGRAVLLMFLCKAMCGTWHHVGALYLGLQ